MVKRVWKYDDLRPGSCRGDWRFDVQYKHGVTRKNEIRHGKGLCLDKC